MRDMSESNNSTGGGIGFCGLLTVAFVVLKLCHVINWSWVWVLAPLWIGATLGILICLIALAVAIAFVRK